MDYFCQKTGATMLELPNTQLIQAKGAKTLVFHTYRRSRP
jgi:hypothetical protein